QRKAVRRHPLRDVDTDCGQLLFRECCAGIAAAEGADAGAFWNALGHHAEVDAGSNESLFEHAHKIHGPKMRPPLAWEVAAQVDIRVADALPRAVIRHAAAAVNLV